MNRLTVILLFAVAATLMSCRSSKENTRETADTVRSMPAQPGPGIPPSHCRITGTVLSIDQRRMGGADDPCSKAPCLATIKVDEILGYGSGFTEILGQGKEIKVRFRYTLAPSESLFPNMVPALPGLAVGGKFQTDLLMLGPSLAGSDESGFIVEQYQRK